MNTKEKFILEIKCPTKNPAIYEQYEAKVDGDSVLLAGPWSDCDLLVPIDVFKKISSWLDKLSHRCLDCSWICDCGGHNDCCYGCSKEGRNND